MSLFSIEIIQILNHLRWSTHARRLTGEIRQRKENDGRDGVKRLLSFTFPPYSTSIVAGARGARSGVAEPIIGRLSAFSVPQNVSFLVPFFWTRRRKLDVT
ncbi:hypothetical protein BaRGS_00011857 [Batillaria attramentaria]|uniref:Uncharacterized protein n=1 Tax=Batillaria attramentaria TaxID=370345 RepID=A0ABD0LBF2_9CAEN